MQKATSFRLSFVTNMRVSHMCICKNHPATSHLSFLCLRDLNLVSSWQKTTKIKCTIALLLSGVL